jgi:hypothetical protein
MDAADGRQQAVQQEQQQQQEHLRFETNQAPLKFRVFKLLELDHGCKFHISGFGLGGAKC